MRVKKVDTTQPELVAAARQLGAKVYLVNQVFDAVVLWKGRNLLVDFKTLKGKRNPKYLRTASQIAMEAEGWEIHYVPTVRALRDLLFRPPLEALVKR